MKFIVDELPKTCEECKFKARAMFPSPLGVMKEIVICTLQTSLIPPTDPTQEPNNIDVTKTPVENSCPCTDNTTNTVKSSLIL